MSNYLSQLSKLASVIDALYEDAMHSPSMKKQALEDMRSGYLTKVAGKRQDDDVAFIDPRENYRPFQDFETDEDTDLDEDLERLISGDDDHEDDEEEVDEDDLARYLEEESEAMEDFEYPAPPGPKFY